MTQDQTIEQKINAFRARLLNLTANNRLINFKYPKTATIRIISVPADEIYDALLKKEEISFKAMDKLRKKSEVDYQLPTKTDSTNATRLTFSTDLFADEMEKRLRNLRIKAKTAIEETGSNFLFLALGFLQWNAPDNAEKLYVAPLLLVPVSLQKNRLNKKTGRYEYTLKYTNDEVIINLALREKLRVDFGLYLPLPEEEMLPSDYLNSVSELVQVNNLPWKVLHHACITLFNFTNLLLYNDLDPERWPNDHDICKHPVIRNFFENADRNNPQSPILRPNDDYLIDELPHAYTRYPIIEDADSSQHSVLIDAVKGENLVVEGPPGTGKSQTITNIIAAFLAHGKKVLFVSEKMAALQVVKTRLDKAGLGDFCLELHSNKTSKRKVLDELLRRVNLHKKNEEALPFMQDVDRYEILKNELSGYVYLIYQKWKTTELIVRDIITKAAYYRDKIGLDAELLHPKGINGENFTRQIQNETENYTRNLKISMQECLKELPKEKKQLLYHPWYGIENDTLQIFNSKKVVELLKNWQDQLVVLNENKQSYGSILKCNTAELPATITEFITMVEDILAFPLLQGDEYLFLLSDLQGENTTFFKSYITEFERIKEIYQIQKQRWQKPAIIENDNAQSIAEAINFLKIVSDKSDISFSTFGLLLERLGKLNEEISGLFTTISESLSMFNLTFSEMLIPSINGMRLLKKILELVILIKPRLLKYRDARFDNDELDELLGNLKQNTKRYNRLNAELKPYFETEKIPDNSNLLFIRKHYATKNGFRYFLSKRWRRGRKAFRDFTIKETTTKHTLLEMYDTLLEYNKSKAIIESNNELKELLGVLYDELNTNTEDLVELRNWYKRVRIAFGFSPSNDALIGEAILNIPEDAAKAFRMFKDKNIITKLNLILSEAESIQHIISGKYKINADDLLTGSEGVLNKLTGSLNAPVQLLKRNITDVNFNLQQLSRFSEELLNFQLNFEKFSENETIKKWFGEDFSLHYTFDSDTANCYKSSIHTIELLENISGKLHSKALLNAFVKNIDDKYLELVKKAAEKSKIIAAKEAEKFNEYAAFTQLNKEKWQSFSADNFEVIIEKNNQALKSEKLLTTWFDFIQARINMINAGYTGLVKLVEKNFLTAENITDAYHLGTYDLLTREIYNLVPELINFSKNKHEVIRREFEEHDNKLKVLQRKKIKRFLLNREVPVGSSGGSVKEYTDLALIKHEGMKKRNQIPIRQLFNRAGDAVLALKPCFMMSPVSVANFMEQGTFMFDLVVMDEASQMKPEYAIGAIARGKQTVIVGDPKQLPPSSFFDKLYKDEDTDTMGIEESESILDTVIPLFKNRILRWHYRSRHQSLIAFSNKAFYDNDLIVFPAPIKRSTKLGITFINTEGVLRNRKNEKEALRIVEIIKQHLLEHKDESLGVVAMNVEQRDFIEDFLEEAEKKDAVLRKLLEENEKSKEPLFIKNLENVQGDERDVIIISFTYGPEQIGGVVTQRFGPLNNFGGWRRLNVLLTRSRKRMVTVSSFLAQDLRTDDSSGRGIIALKQFLHYAETGHLKVDGNKDNSLNITLLEKDIIEELEHRNISYDTHLGVSGFFIDIAIKNPKKKENYVLGILTDGENYHSANSTRDRDRLRLNVLKELGWNIISIWSPDWYKNKEKVINQIIEKII